MLFPDARAAVEHARDQQPVHDPAFDIAAARRDARTAAAAQPREDVAEVRDVDAGGVPCRLYRPGDAAPGVVVHLHGGGFVMNDVEVHDGAARRLANRTGRAVLSVDYRLAPEHPFPAAVDDTDTVLAWLATHADAEGLAGPVALHGDSAGANLALVGALHHPGRFAALALVYPFLDPTASFASHTDDESDFDPETVAWYWRHYAGPAGEAAYADADLAPLLADPAAIAALPPTYVATAEHDPLRDEGEHLARLAADAGVPVTAVRWLGQVHGFWRHHDVFSAADPLMDQVAAFLRGRL
ncbi:MAG: alpha/beta hydrolase [Nocardioides sp.]|nr:alpha/beta hydrolase [Nocardioides sp.]